MRHMTATWVDACLRLRVCVCESKEGRSSVKQADSDGDSDGSAGHVWAAVIDARGTVISKAFQGRHDSASHQNARAPGCMFVCVFVFLCVSAIMYSVCLYTGAKRA